MNTKTQIYLCDMVHDYIGAASYMFPLNIGFLASYVKKEFGSEVDIKLFKFPNDLLKALKTGTPDIVGFSHYMWSANLNMQLAQRVKAKSAKTLVVFGGPDIDYMDFGIKKFFKSVTAADVYIPYQGETPFNSLLSRYLSRNGSFSKKSLMDDVLPGTFLYDADDDMVIKGAFVPRIKDPDVIPSPYLNGMLDEFFNTNLIPIIETNRGCPYKCTFCAQGISSYNMINFFSMDRVKAEMDYIAKKVKNTNLLHFADSNFGIVDRDIEISQYVVDMRAKNSNKYPHKVSSNMAKNRPPEKMIKIAELLGETALIVSLQSMDDVVLERVQRKNIKTKYFKQIIESVNKMGGISGTEIILGLPGETKKSHIDTVRQLFDMNASYIIAYNGLIFGGTELSEERHNGKFICKTKFRLIDSSFGEYFVPLSQAHNVSGKYDDNILSFEVEEGIIATDTMPEGEILYFRPVHWLIQFMWNYRFYYDFLKYMQHLGVNPIDYITRMLEVYDQTGFKKVKALFDDFIEEAKHEWFDTPEDLRAHYSKPENLKNLKEGNHGKMNGKYIFRVLVECKSEFEQFILEVADYFPALKKEKAIFKNIVEFLSESIIDVSKSSINNIKKKKLFVANYDFLAWRKSNYKGDIKDYRELDGINYNIILPEETSRSLNQLFTQYKHSNINVTLRKMSEHMPIKEFYYKISRQNETLEDADSASSLIERQEDRMGVGQ